MNRGSFTSPAVAVHNAPCLLMVLIGPPRPFLFEGDTDIPHALVQVIKGISMLGRYASSVILLVFSMSSAVVHAQGGGSLTYGAVSQAVPVNGGIWLVILFAVIAIVGFTVLRRQKLNATVGALLVITGVVSVISLGAYVQDSDAIPAAVQLDNPSGGSVPVPEGYQQYVNSSGVQL